MTQSNIDSINSIAITTGIEMHQFEHWIISAYKATDVNESYKALISALSNVTTYIESIKSQSKPQSQPNTIVKPLLTQSIIQRLKRIVNRHYFHLNIQISKIYIALLNNEDTFPYIALNTNTNLLIEIANDVIVLLDLVQFTPIHRTLLKHNQAFLKYVHTIHTSSSSSSQSNEEQLSIINTLLSSLPSKYVSDTYTNFSNKLKEMLIEKKSTKTFDEFTSHLTMLMSLEEQYDSLKLNETLYFLTNYLKINIESKVDLTGIENNSNSNQYKNKNNNSNEDSDVLFLIGKMITMFLFNTTYTIDTTNGDDSNTDDSCRTYMLIDAYKKNVSKIQSNSYSNISFSFLNDSIYEISNDQKDLMLSNKTVLSYLVKLYITKVLIAFPKKFDIQYVCFVLLKRVWFYFNDVYNNNEFNALLLEVIDNIARNTQISHQFSNEMIEVCEFVYFLSNNSNNRSNDDISKLCLIKERLLSIIGKSDIMKPNKDKTALAISSEVFNIRDSNVLTGYPITITIEAGAMHTQYIDITNENSLIYIYFTVSYKDISFSLLKYNTNNSNTNAKEANEPLNDDHTDKGHFSKVFQLDYVKCSSIPIKIILFAQSPGVYKVIFDNSYSWITSKEVKCRINILKPVMKINDVITINESNVDNITKKFNVYYNSIDYSLDVYDISTTINELYGQKEHVVIPIILYKNILIMVLNENTTIRAIDISNTKAIGMEFFNKSIEEFLINNELIPNETISSITLSFLPLDLNNSFNDNDSKAEDNDNRSKDHDDPITLCKDSLDSYMKPLMEKYSNRLKYYFNYLNDIALIDSIYNKEKDNKEYETIVYFHIDSHIAQVSIYNDGMIYAEVKGFDYDDTKSLLENIGLFIEVIKKTNESFENITVELSYTNVDVAIINDFMTQLNKDLEKAVNSISIYPLKLTHLHLLLSQ